MGEKVSIGRKYSLAAGETKTFEAYTVPDARKFKLTRVCVHFPAGTEGKVEVTVYHGLRQIVPREGSITGDSDIFCFECEQEYDASSIVYVRAVNNDTSNSHEFSVELEGELM